MNDETVKYTLRIDKNFNNELDTIVAESDNSSKNDLIIEALKLYRDNYYCKNKATFLNENVLSSMQAMMEGLEHRLNNKTNQLLSELAIEQGIIAQLLAYSLDVSGDTVADYRKKAVEYLKVNQRVLRLDKLIE